MIAVWKHFAFLRLLLSCLVLSSFAGLASCRRNQAISNLESVPTDIPICKTEGIISKDFTLKYEVSETGQTMMVRDSGKGFTCRLDQITDDGFPLCTKACSTFTRPTPVWGFCHGAKVFECYNPAVANGGGQGDKGSPNSPGSPGSDAANGFKISFYDPSTFGGKCPPPLGLTSSQGIAPAEGALGLVCTDNWVKVSNPWQVQDVEEGDLRDAKKNHPHIVSKFDYLNFAAEKCGGTCVKKNGNQYEINLPTCKMPGSSNACDNKVYTMTTNLTGKKEFKVFIESSCPARHWKNLVKKELGVDNNHCASPSHVDLSTGLTPELGFDNMRQEEVKVYIK